MAAAGMWDLRSPNYIDRALMYPLLDIITARGVKNLKIISYRLFQESPDTKAEIRVNYTDEFDGVGTPVEVDVKSSSGNDALAGPGTGAQTVGMLGIDENDDYVIELIEMEGASAVTTTTLWKRLLQLKVLTAGSGKKAAGNITVHEVGATTKTYMTIAANGLSTISARLYIPDGKTAVIGFLMGNSIFTTAAATVDVDAGSNLYPIYADEDLTREILHKYTIIPGRNLQPIPTHLQPRVGSGDNYFTLQHEALNTGKNKDFHVDQLFITWEEH